MNKTVLSSKACVLLLLPGLLLTSSLNAGEVYGRVAINGKVYANASVTIRCPNYKDTQSTNNNGAYRLAGPRGEQQCKISTSGAANAVPVITSQGRTRANLEVKDGRLYRR